MDRIAPLPHGEDDTLARVAALVPRMQAAAPRLDDAASFPIEDIAALRDAGALALALPVEQRSGDHTRLSAQAERLAQVLALIGEGNLAAGRIVEAHFNARHLIARYGSAEQRDKADRDVRNGHLFALWVTDPPDGHLRVTDTPADLRLSGGKMFCSAAAHATRAVVTAVDRYARSRMLILELGGGERARPLPSPLQGMRAAVTGAVDFTGCVAPRNAILGEAGDYLREPDFSAGAWRGSAVAAGGLGALLGQVKAQLHATGRIASPHQLQRLGEALIALETSRLWLGRAAQIAEGPGGDPAHIVAYVGLARIAIEAACLDAMRLVQRSLGLSAFRHGNPIELICRDLGTYLRQPAPDEVLTEAAGYFAGQSGISDP
jgi:alkylation response protein AidB-like acyl-CoA dehydrogenase